MDAHTISQSTHTVRNAATIIITREKPGQKPDILCLKRASTMAFAAGAFVFPGGAVDPDDQHIANQLEHDLAQDEAAARIAAIRESIEECGIGIGVTSLTPDTLSAVRKGLHQKQLFSDLLVAHELHISLDALTPFARWQPSGRTMAKRIYDTRFYLARAPEGQEASVDETENVDLLWSSAIDILARCDAGDGHIIFPTRRNLERIAPWDSHDALVTHTASFPVEKITPWIEDRDGEQHLCIPDHLGYPITSEPLGRAQRG